MVNNLSKEFLMTFLVLFMAISLANSCPPPSGYFLRFGNYYKIYTTPATHYEAWKTCTLDGAYLGRPNFPFWWWILKNFIYKVDYGGNISDSLQTILYKYFQALIPCGLAW